jgi:hypothetical protein
MCYSKTRSLTSDAQKIKRLRMMLEFGSEENFDDRPGILGDIDLLLS